MGALDRGATIKLLVYASEHGATSIIVASDHGATSTCSIKS